MRGLTNDEGVENIVTLELPPENNEAVGAVIDTCGTEDPETTGCEAG